MKLTKNSLRLLSFHAALFFCTIALSQQPPRLRVFIFSPGFATGAFIKDGTTQGTGTAVIRAPKPQTDFLYRWTGALTADGVRPPGAVQALTSLSYTFTPSFFEVNYRSDIALGMPHANIEYAAAASGQTPIELKVENAPIRGARLLYHLFPHNDIIPGLERKTNFYIAGVQLSTQVNRQRVEYFKRRIEKPLLLPDVGVVELGDLAVGYHSMYVTSIVGAGSSKKPLLGIANEGARVDVSCRLIMPDGVSIIYAPN